MYVLVRNDGLFVAPPGRERSYVERLQDAARFDTRADAERNRCVENERVAEVADLLVPWGRK